MSAPIRCPHCSQTETIWVKPAWTWEVRQTGWLWWKRIRAVRVHAGDCVVCLRCDGPYVVTASGSFAKRKAMPQVVGSPRHANNAAAIEQLHAAVNVLPDEAP